jgi:bifunctional DNA-binding transcriptional regulator/antitoxin component of YhaV-PrlF toxin-antitoxin module
MSDDRNESSKITVNISENHNLLYYNIPKKMIEKLQLKETDILEYDIRNEAFICRKKGSKAVTTEHDSKIFSGLQVERSITRNNTILRTNLPKEVALPLEIKKGDLVKVTLERGLFIGHRANNTK